MKSMKFVACMTTAVVGIALSASAATVIVTDEFGTALSNGVLTVSPLNGPAESSDMAPSVQGTALRNGYSVDVEGPAIIEFEHNSYGNLVAKGMLTANGTIELVISRGQDGYVMGRLGQEAAASVPNRAGGATCATAVDIPWTNILAGYTDSGNTGSTNTQPVSCGISGSDTFYKFTAGGNRVLKLTTCLPGTPDDTVLQVKNGTCGTTVACNDDSCVAPPGGDIFNSTLAEVTVTAGQTYTIQIDNWASNLPTNYSLQITDLGAPFELDPPAGGCIDEGEPLCGLNPLVACGALDNTNGGCNFVPNRFTSVACGDTICGTYGNCGTSRDTDWFTTVETSIRIGTWCCVGEKPMNVGALNLGGNTGTCPLTSSSFIAVGTGVTGCRTALMYPGTFGWFAGLQTFSGVPCGAEYQCTLTCACPAPCVDDTGSSAAGEGFAGDAESRVR